MMTFIKHLRLYYIWEHIYFIEANVAGLCMYSQYVVIMHRPPMWSMNFDLVSDGGCTIYEVCTLIV